MGVCQSCQQGGFASIGKTYECDLCCALPLYVIEVALARFLLSYGLFFELGESSPEVCPEFVRSLVFRDGCNELFKCSDLFCRCTCLFVSLFRFEVFWWKIGWHIKNIP